MFDMQTRQSSNIASDEAYIVVCIKLQMLDGS